MQRSELDTPLFVGRSRELSLLEVAWRHARAGRGRLVTLSGPAGIGKSRLVETFAASIQDTDGRVVWVRCLEQSGAPAFWPWSRLVRVLDSSPDGLVAAGLGRVASSAGSDAGDRFALFEVFATWLRTVSGDRPLLVAFEDLQWADEASHVLLEFLAEELGGMRCLVLGTYRQASRLRPPPALGRAIRRGERLEVHELSADAVGEIVAHLEGAADPVLVGRLMEATRGNPFFVIEVLRGLAAERQRRGSLDPSEPLALPKTLRESIVRLIEPLGTDVRELLATAAVIGREFDVALLMSVSGRALEEVLRDMQPAIEQDLVVELAGPGRFQFVHALVRDTIYAELPIRVRMQLHAAVGDALEAQHAADPEPPLGALVGHFVHAAPLGTAVKAIAYATRAGRHARSLRAYQDALVAFEQALAVTVIHPAEADRLALHLAAADAAWAAGLDPRAIEHFLAAVRDARARNDDRGFFRATVGLARIQLRRTDTTVETEPLLDEALERVGDGDSRARATLLGLRGLADRIAGRTDDAEARLTAGVAMARRTGDPQGLADVLVIAALAMCGPEAPQRRLAATREALALFEPNRVSALALATRFRALLETGDVEAATVELHRLDDMARRSRRPEDRWTAAVLGAGLAMLQGRFDDGERLAVEALGMRRSANDPKAFSTFVTQMFVARRDTGALGRDGGLEGSVRWLASQAEHGELWQCLLTIHLIETRRMDEARARFDALAAAGFRLRRPATNQPAFLCLLAAACGGLKDTDRARELYALLLPYAGAACVWDDQAWMCAGPVDGYLALLARVLGRYDEGAIHAEAALAMAERMGARSALASIAHAYAQILIARGGEGDHARALAYLERSREIARLLKMQALGDWVEVTTRQATARESGRRSAETPQAVTPAQETRLSAVLRRDGDVWEVGFEGATRRVKDARGFRLLAALVRQPEIAIHVLDLDASNGRGAVDPMAPLDRGDAGPLLDRAARTAYKRRIEDVRDELEEAEQFNDSGRAERLRREVEFLSDELSRGVGLGGRHRRAASAAERARVNATRTIGAVIKKIGTLDPRLGEHLRATVKTGILCVYAPGPSSIVDWKL